MTIEVLDEGQKVSAATTANPLSQSRLGVQVAEVSSDIREKMDVTFGVVVSKLTPLGAAAAAGIKEGDVLLSFDREQINGVKELEKLVSEAPANEAIPVLVQRGTSPMFLALTLPAANS